MAGTTAVIRTKRTEILTNLHFMCFLSLDLILVGIAPRGAIALRGDVPPRAIVLPNCHTRAAGFWFGIGQSK
jgi:hypothetical protein